MDNKTIDECIETVLQTECTFGEGVRACCATLDKAVNRLKSLKEVSTMTKFVEAIECETCKALHRAGSKTYVDINVDIGYDTSRFGTFCKRFDCMEWLIKDIAIDAVKKQEINIRGPWYDDSPSRVIPNQPYLPKSPRPYEITCSNKHHTLTKDEINNHPQIHTNRFFSDEKPNPELVLNVEEFYKK